MIHSVVYVNYIFPFSLPCKASSLYWSICENGRESMNKKRDGFGRIIYLS